MEERQGTASKYLRGTFSIWFLVIYQSKALAVVGVTAVAATSTAVSTTSAQTPRRLPPPYEYLALMKFNNMQMLCVIFSVFGSPSAATISQQPHPHTHTMGAYAYHKLWLLYNNI
jgi:hypothetical protein